MIAEARAARGAGAHRKTAPKGLSLGPSLLLSTYDVAAELKISRPVAAQLMAAEVGGPVSLHGATLLVDDAFVDALREWEPVEKETPALNVKVVAARWVPAEGRWFGWHRRLPPAAMEAAVGRWWSVRDADEMLGNAFVVTIGGWVVHVARITGVQTVNTRRAFAFAEPTAEQAACFVKRRLPPERGALVQRLGGC